MIRLLLITLTSTALAQSPTPGLVPLVNEGLRAKEAQDWPAAIAAFEKVVTLAPQLPAAHVNLGAVYFEAKNYSAAILSLRRALSMKDDLPGAHGLLGSALLTQGFADEAIPHLEKGQMTGLLGIALLAASRERDAIEKLEDALTRDPTNPDIIYYLTQAHGRLAKQLANRLNQQFPAEARTRQLRAEAHQASGNRQATRQEYLAALQLRPDLPGVHLALGELFWSEGDFPAAEREFAAEAKLTPGSPYASYRWGAALLQNGNLPAALAALEAAEKVKPGMPETLLELGRARLAAASLPAAELAFQQVIAAEPASALAESAHFQLAALYRRLNRNQDADREMAQFRKLRAARTAP